MDWKGLQIYILCKVLKLYNSKCFCYDICNYVHVQFGNKLSIYLSIYHVQLTGNHDIALDSIMISYSMLNNFDLLKTVKYCWHWTHKI